MTVDKQTDFWNKVLKRIEMEVSGPNYKTWFQDTFIINISNNIIELGVPHKIVKDWLANKFHCLILKVVNEFNPNIKNIDYVISKKTQNSSKTSSEKGGETQNDKTDVLPIYKKMSVSVKDNLNPKYTFDTFVVGSFNQLAHAAAVTIIENPGITYNPLFIYGSTGHGKTHLIQAIGNELKKNIPSFRVFYVSSEQFAVDYVNAIKSGKANSFKDKYRQYDLIIMDDIQFIADKEQTQEELFHLFNAMHDKNKQIVFSSDKHPNQIPGFAERLVSRFSAGMIAEIPSPDYESRIEILKTKAGMQGVELNKKTMELIAKELPGNIRELEGALNLVVVQSKVKGDNLSEKEIKDILKQISKPRKNLSMDVIIEKVTDYYGISKNDIKKKSRKKDLVHPRQVLMFLLREDFDESFPNIGSTLGGRDHTTVMHSYEKIKNSLEDNLKLQQEIDEIRGIFQSMVE